MIEVADGGTLPAAMYTRPNDAKAVLDKLSMIASVAGVTIDTNRLGVLGHSGGAHAVMALSGSVTDVSQSVHDMPMREPRFRAYVANSPQGIGHIGMIATSWDRIAVPMLVQTGKADNHNGELVSERLEAYEHLRGPDAYLHYVDSAAANHEFFSLSDPVPAGEQTYVAATALAFLDAYVRERKEAIDWLASDALSKATNGVSTLTVK
jgi:predicted dienelactone hydrolase